MSRELDALTSSTLKHLRERWWTDSFTEFLVETLRPRPGRRLLDVGCGTGIAEISISRLRLSQVSLVGVDLLLDRVRAASAAARGINARASYAAADALALPFGNGAFDSTYCVAVLQHLRDVSTAVKELARVTRPGGNLLIVEPDNAARYWFSSIPSGMETFALGQRFFAALADTGSEAAATQTGPVIPGLLTACGVEPVSVQLFPVTVSHLGPPEASVWDARRSAIQNAMDRAPDQALRRLGADYIKAIDQYARDADAAGATFVEIQNTMLFATVGKRAES